MLSGHHSSVELVGGVCQFNFDLELNQPRQVLIRLSDLSLKCNRLGNLISSVNAVKAQILFALTAFVLVQLLRFALKTSISIPDAMAVIGTLLLQKSHCRTS